MFMMKLVISVTEDMAKMIDDDKLPENWSGPEMRLWIAEKFQRTRMLNLIVGKRRKDYHNDVLVNNL